MAMMMALAAEPKPDDAFFVVVSVVMGSAFLVTALLGLLFMTMVVAPNLTQRFSTTLRERNVTSFFTGIPVFLGLGSLTAMGGSITPALGAVVGLGFTITLLVGIAAAAEDIGRRLFWTCGKEGSRASHLAAGWLIVATGALFPIIGWFLILPWVVSSGLGSIVLGTFRHGPAEVEFKD